MTKEEWKQAEEALTHFFHPVELKVDGYDITLILERVSVYQNKIMVYIGGEFRGQWMAEDCEVRRRFLQEQRHNILSGLLFRDTITGQPMGKNSYPEQIQQIQFIGSQSQQHSC